MAAGDLYVVGLATDRIYRRPGGYGGRASWDAGITVPSSEGVPLGIAFDAGGDLYVTGVSTDKIYRRAGGYGGASWDAGIAAPRLETSLTGIAFDSAGDLYAVGSGTDKIYRRAGGYGGASWDAGIAVPRGEENPREIAFDSAGNLYVVGLTTDKIYRRAGGYGGASWDAGIAVPSAEGRPAGLAFDSAGNLYVSGFDTRKIYRRAGGYGGASWDAGIAVPASETFPSDVAFEPSRFLISIPVKLGVAGAGAAVAIGLLDTLPRHVELRPPPIGIAGGGYGLDVRLIAPPPVVVGVRLGAAAGRPGAGHQLHVTTVEGAPPPEVLPGTDPVLHALVEAKLPTGTIRAWTGEGPLRFGGRTYEAGAGVLTVDGLGTQLRGNVAGRVGLVMPPGTRRTDVLMPIGPVPVTVHAVLSEDRGVTWRVVRTRKGVLSTPRLAGDAFTFEVAPPNADVDRGRIRRWSHADQQRRFPGDRGLEKMRSIADKKFRWPTV